MLSPPHADVLNRRPVWGALSELFLDTSFDASDKDRIAGILAQSPYNVSDLEHILLWEVGSGLSPQPVLDCRGVARIRSGMVGITYSPWAFDHHAAVGGDARPRLGVFVVELEGDQAGHCGETRERFESDLIVIGSRVWAPASNRSLLRGINWLVRQEVHRADHPLSQLQGRVRGGVQVL